VIVASYIAMLCCAVLCVPGGTPVADWINRVFTAGLMALFFLIIGVGGTQADWGSLGAVADWTQAPTTVPIIFLALVCAGKTGIPLLLLLLC
jgi:hypothetical protein